jgi:hypothetical protein
MVRNIKFPSTGKLYMRRRYLWGAPTMPDGSSPFDEFGAVRPEAGRTTGTQCFKHTIEASDDRSAIHNHPWQWGVSLILAGGYIEERYYDDVRDAIKAGAACNGKMSRYADGWIVRRRLSRGDVLRLTGDTFHRVELIDNKPAHTLFLAGPIKSGWGFMDDKGKFTESSKYRKEML